MTDAAGDRARYRRPVEVAVVVHRRGTEGPEYLVLLRSPQQQGYWHLVAGGVGWDEERAAAAARELWEETRLGAPVLPLELELSYALDDEPEEVRRRFPPGTARVAVGWFHAEAPGGWEPSLDDEHVDHRWCDAVAAVELLRWPEPKEAVRETHRVIGGGA
jgi:8-oxo-dGTP pyrophosphatase MutT (NUDIX family)